MAQDGAQTWVSLWEGATHIPIRPGQMISGIDVLTTHSGYHKCITLSASYLDEIKVIIIFFVPIFWDQLRGFELKGLVPILNH